MDLKVPLKDKEKRKEYNRIYNEENKEKISLRKGKYNKIYDLKNKEEISNKKRNYYIKNKEKISIRQKKYYLDNKEKILIKTNQYKMDNRESNAISDKKYYEDHKEEIKKYRKKWAQSNPEKRRLTMLKQMELRKDWGIEPINKYFKGAHFHHLHIDRNHSVGIYIPADLHRSIPHRHNNQDSMNKINKEAIKWYK